jgi:hypothetical protein
MQMKQLITTLDRHRLEDRSVREMTGRKPLPVSKSCKACGRVFTRPTRNRDGRYRLRSTDKWRTQKYCTVECLIEWRKRSPWKMWPVLPGYLAKLEPVKPGR